MQNGGAGKEEGQTGGVKRRWPNCTNGGAALLMRGHARPTNVRIIASVPGNSYHLGEYN